MWGGCPRYPPDVDTLLSPILDSLRGCVCTALGNTLGGSVECSCSIMPGLEAPADWCSCKGAGTCGMAWVRLDRIYPSSQRFPSPDATSGGGCVTVLAAVLEVGVYRCQPTPTGQGQPPAPSAVTQAALVAADDALALVGAITCCEAITKRPYVLGAYSPRGTGGCGGGAWTVTVQLTRKQ